MFLKRILSRGFSRSGSRERGSALIGVLGIMSVTSVIAVTATSMSMHAVGYTTSTRAGVQAEAAAEAGVDYAAANLATSACQSQYSSTTAPIFVVNVSYSTLATSPGAIDNSWAQISITFLAASELNRRRP